MVPNINRIGVGFPVYDRWIKLSESDWPRNLIIGSPHVWNGFNSWPVSAFDNSHCSISCPLCDVYKITKLFWLYSQLCFSVLCELSCSINCFFFRNQLALEIGNWLIIAPHLFRSVTTQMSKTKMYVLFSTHAIVMPYLCFQSLWKPPSNKPCPLKISLTHAHRKLSNLHLGILWVL